MSAMLKDQDLVSVQEVRSKVEEAYAAWQKYRAFSQEQVDAIVEQVAAAARANARRLAEMAVEETGYGNAKDKLAKNLLCCDVLPRAMRGLKTIGIIREIPEKKIIEIGVPMGVVAAILPTTNPTSTAMYKTLISLKSGNAVVISPHPRAKGCTCETAAVLQQAALQAGAPEGLVQCINNSTLEATNALMKHHRTGVILSTGGSGIVRAAYSSGKPAYGVGPGNVPVLVDTSADLEEAVGKVVEGKSFDYGTVCSSEQTIVAEHSLRERILSVLKARKAFLCDAQQTAALAKLLVTPTFGINPDCVGQPPTKIAKMAGFEIPADTSIIVVEIQGVGKQHPLSAEKLSPVLSLYFVANFAAAMDACEAILKFGGLGHTSVIHANDDARIRDYGLRMPSFRVLVNTPSPQGSTGITTNVFPAMTLGCGAVAGNITSDNVGPLSLINVKRVAYAARKAEDAFEHPEGTSDAVSSTPVSIDRRTVVAAVERYLEKRGVPQAPPVITSVVDRFLAAKRSGVPAAVAPSEPPATAPAPPAPTVEIADFVCEDDVRKAVAQSKKIYIGPKTIVTPSARDLALRTDTLVLTEQRSASK
ncbi:MAG TPA: aldehyde dehydrogenase family protein [Bryobacteraceae bacterium]|nr:aldehyde dehydrogenase family protein [Bryobacteraceae bacterium]